MLHVFAVNRGQMMTFDVGLAMQRVADLKNEIFESSKIGVGKQVLLINGGQALNENTQVCKYAAGTESNPIYVFDKSSIESPSINFKSKLENVDEFASEILTAQRLQPSYNTVVQRTQIAIRMNESTRKQVTSMKQLVTAEHLMFQGWQAAIANLNDTLTGFQQRIITINQQCAKLLLETKKYVKIFDGLEEVITMLGHLTLLPSLVNHEASPPKTLLEWIESKCHNVKVENMVKDCQQRMYQLTQGKLEDLLNSCKKVLEQGQNTRMREIAGIDERLGALDQVIIAAEQQSNEQRGIAQGFVKNQETARAIKDEPMNFNVIFPLCESHITQLQIMHENESATREAMVKCDSAKSELAKNLHTRIRWLYFIQRSILNADVKLSMFHEQLMQFKHQAEFLEQVKEAPDAYFNSLTECVRRKTFSQMFSQWMGGILTASKVARDKEIFRRKTFKTLIGNNFVQQLFPGFSDKPPVIAKRPLRQFDQSLPKITLDELNLLSSHFPQFKFNEPQIESLPDPSQLSWQMVLSTTTKSAINQSHRSVLDDSVQSTMTSYASSPPAKQELYRSMNSQPNFLPGGFVETSVQNLIQNQKAFSSPPSITSSSALKNFSPPRLNSPSSDDVINDVIVGSPDSGEFVSLIPDLLGGEEQRISEEREDSEMFVKLQQPSQLTISSDEEMFHSFTSELQKEKILVRMKESESEKDIKEDESIILIRKLQSEITELENSRQKMSQDFEARWVESKMELDNLIGQLESEKNEKIVARKNEESSRQEIQELKVQLSNANEKAANLQNELSAKLEMLSNFESESKKQQDSVQIEITNVQENAERLVWEAQRGFESDKTELSTKISTLERDLRLKNDELCSADDRIQELESELSNSETKLGSIQRKNTEHQDEIDKLMKKLEENDSFVSQAKGDIETAEIETLGAKEKLAQFEEKYESLKSMLAAYELELENVRQKNTSLKQCQNQLEIEISEKEAMEEKVQELNGQLGLKDEEMTVLDRDFDFFRKEVSEKTRNLEEKAQATETELIEKNETFDKKLEEGKKVVADSYQRKIDSLKNDYQMDLERIKDENKTKVDKMSNTHRMEMDELEADRLESVLSIQQQLQESRDDFQLLKDTKDLDITKMQIDFQKEKDRLQSIIHDRQQQSAMMTSSIMTSSPDASESKRTRMEETMSVCEHRVAVDMLQSSFKRKEEDATRRRQLVFNSSIHRVTAMKDAEIERLKKVIGQQNLATSQTESMTTSTASHKQKDKIVVSNFQFDDIVLIAFDKQYCHPVVVTISNTLHFLHNESINELGFRGDHGRVMARFIEKEYCQARKANNRFKVAIGTKFYRVKVAPLSKLPPDPSD